MKTTIRNVVIKGSKKTSIPITNAVKHELDKLLKSCSDLQDLSNSIALINSDIKDNKLADLVLNKKITLKKCKRELQLLHERRRNFNYLLNKVLPLFIDQAIEEQNTLLLKSSINIQKYRYLARFKIRPCDLINIKGYDLLLKHGFYNKDTNPNGVVKDHRYSIKDGFDNKIDPEILGHLSNCEFLIYKDNILKK